ncbi:Hypothetical protein NTJ_08387 [Nesidiocoris tenuis]|uniref:Protein NATD1 n=1 Tax=Nesidiocoris tenuis TaxID=355587 RepID=A0ABN7AUE0_9HEMI|nr:Hypothetical protein NTJ_08387 [Nesidiocoris tenuis]
MKLPMDTAYVGYFPSNNALNLYSIFVPKRYREIGIGQELAQDVLEYCAEHNLQVILSCPYLITFYKQHPYPKFKNIVKGIAAPKTTEIRPNDSDNN